MVDETPQRIAVVLRGTKDAFDLVAVSELNFSTCRERDQQRHQVPRDLLIRSQQMFLVVPNAGELDAIRVEIARMRELTERPFGVNIAQAFVRDPKIVDFIIEQGVRFVTTSAGDPKKYTAALKEAGLTVFHVVPTLRAAQKAVDAGVDGLVVEGGEGGGFKGPEPISTLVLVPLIRQKLDVPIIAAGGICDGASMAAAFALGAEGVQMGTRMVSAAESPIHDNWKKAIVETAETGTVFLRNPAGPSLRALRTERTQRIDRERGKPMADLAQGVRDVYFEGDLEAGIALTGQVAGRIESVPRTIVVFFGQIQ